LLFRNFCNAFSGSRSLLQQLICTNMLYFFTLLLALIGHPEPRFRAQTIDAGVSIGYGLAVGDVDGDGKLDILLADQKSFVWYRNGDWKKFVMVENLTGHDNVCIAAKDLDGDGRVEVAVGAQWNPAETGDATASGSVHFLIAPADVTQPWRAVPLYHEPTIHRMRWFQGPEGRQTLAVLPLHGRNNKQGAGEGVRVLLYHYPDMLLNPSLYDTLPSGMHLTHNFTVLEEAAFQKPMLCVAGKEGIRYFDALSGKTTAAPYGLPVVENSAGEVKVGKLAAGKPFLATIEPMHGNNVVAYVKEASTQRQVIDSTLKEGHALVTADFLATGMDQIVAGWRMPDKDGKVGIKLYAKKSGGEWVSYWVDENGMACEDIQVADLNGDGKPDLVAAGRSTHNLKIYWNQVGK
jgi:hypothetical protein